MKVELHPSGASILFDPKWHSYKNLTRPRQRFISGTKFLGQFFGKFDRESISAKYAKKHNKSQTEVLNMWDRKGEIGREMGTLIHDYLEAKFLASNKDARPLHDVAALHKDEEIQAAALRRMPQADIAYDKLRERYDIIAVEKIVADLDGSRAGMIDLVLRDRLTGLECLGDWKTNAKIDLENRWQQGLSCLRHLDDCSYNKYAIQMELYKQIGLKEGYFKEPMGPNVIIHITDDDHTILPCPDMSREIKAMIQEADELIV
jgi:hypothetical protein